jgi:hypothetical protein
LSHTSSLFCSGYFGDERGNLSSYLPGLALNHNPPVLNPPSSYDLAHMVLI